MIAPTVVVVKAMGAVHSTHRDNSSTQGMQRITFRWSFSLFFFHMKWFVIIYGVVHDHVETVFGLFVSEILAVPFAVFRTSLDFRRDFKIMLAA